MGYMLTDLAHLPLDEDVTLYIFVLDNSWGGYDSERLRQNFPKLAAAIGKHAVIVSGLNEERWPGEIAQRYLGKHHQDLAHLLPALLLSDAHPNNLREKSMRLLVPLDDAKDRFG